MPDTLTFEEAAPEAQALSFQDAKPEPETSAAGTAARSVATGVAPGAAFVAGFEAVAPAATALAAETGPAAPFIGGGAGVLAGAGAAAAVSYGQGKLLQKVAPKFYEKLVRGEEEHPVAAAVGGIASMAPSAKLAPFNLATLPFRAGVGATVSAIPPLVFQHRLPTKREIAEGTVASMIYGGPRKWLRGRPAATPTAPGEPSDASQIGQATTLYGNVRPQRKPTGPLPAQRGGPGVQPQTQARVPQEEPKRLLLNESEFEELKNLRAAQEFHDIGQGRALTEKETSRLVELESKHSNKVLESNPMAHEISDDDAQMFEARAALERSAASMSDTVLNQQLRVVTDTTQEFKSRGEEVPDDLNEQYKVLFAERRKRIAQWGEPVTSEPVDVAKLERMAIDEGEKHGQSFVTPEQQQRTLGQTDDPSSRMGEHVIMKAMGGGRIALNQRALSLWARDVPQSRHAEGIQAIVDEERIHNQVIDSIGQEGALAYWGDLSALEKAAERRIYLGEWRQPPDVSDTMMGHEAIRRRLQLAAGQTPREFIETVGRENWTVRGLSALSSMIRGARESLGTKASQRQLELLGRMEANVNAATAFVQESPEARRRKQAESQRQQVMPLSSTLKKEYQPESQFRGQPAAPMKFTGEQAPVEHPGAKQFAETYKYPEATPEALETATGQYMKAELTDKAGYNDFSAKMSAQFGPKLEGYQVAEAWDKNISKVIHQSTGADLKRWLRETGLWNRFVRGKDRKEAFARLLIPDAPRPGERVPSGKSSTDQSTRLRAQGALLNHFASTTAEMAKRGLLDRKSIDFEELGWDRHTPGSVWSAVPESIGKDPLSFLSWIKSKGEGRVYGELVSVTRRLLALKNKKIGTVDLVSAYLDPRRGLVLQDPERTGAAGVKYEDVLTTHEPLYTGLARDPVKDFREHFQDEKAFMEKLGNKANERVRFESAVSGYEDPDVVQTFKWSQHPGESVTQVRTEEPGEKPLTDHEAGALYDSLTREHADLRTPEQVRQHIASFAQRMEQNRIERAKYDEALSSYERLRQEMSKQEDRPTAQDKPEEFENLKKKFVERKKELESYQPYLTRIQPSWSIISAYKKIYDSIRIENQNLDPGDALKKLYEEVQQSYAGARERNAFIQSILGRYGSFDLEDVRRLGTGEAAPAETGARELEAKPSPAIAREGIGPSLRVRRREVSPGRWEELHPPTKVEGEPLLQESTPKYFPTRTVFPAHILAENVPGRPARPTTGHPAFRGDPSLTKRRYLPGQEVEAAYEAGARRGTEGVKAAAESGEPYGEEQPEFLTRYSEKKPRTQAESEELKAAAKRQELEMYRQGRFVKTDKPIQSQLKLSQKAGGDEVKLPPKPKGQQRGLFGDEPAAWLRSKKEWAEEWQGFKDSIRAWTGRRNLKNEEIYATMDRVANRSDLRARQFGQRVRVSSFKALPQALQQVRSQVAAASWKDISMLPERTTAAWKTARATSKEAVEAAKRRSAAKAVIASSELQYLSVLRGAGIRRAPFLIPNRMKLNDLIALADKAIWESSQLMRKQDLRDSRIGRERFKAATRLREDAVYAQQHWHEPEFTRTVQALREGFKTQIEWEKQHGVKLKEKFAFYPGRYEAELWNDNSVIFGNQYLGGKFWKAKTFDNHWEAIAAGPYIPKNYDGADVLEHRVRQGSRVVERKLWREHLMNTPDKPVSGEPIAKYPSKTKSGDPEPPPDYELVSLDNGKNVLAVRRGYARTVEAAGGGGGFKEGTLLGDALRFSQFLKHHGILIYDTFHPMRLFEYALATTGRRAGYHAGHTLLDFREADLPKAVAAGIIDPRSAAWAQQTVQVNFGGQKVPMSRKQLLDLAVDEKANIGRLQDALYSGTFKYYFPGANWLNKKVFDQITRGLMIKNVIETFEKYNAKRPDIPVRTLMRDVVKDANVFYGNLGRQGVVGKNPTVRDLLQTFFLAPGWVEGLAAKELKFYSRITGTSRLLGRSGLPVLGNLGSGMAKGLAAFFVLTQALNLLTRRKPTWENEEPDHKWDAWIGGEGGEGFWISPLSVFAELSHDILRLAETKPKVWDAIDQVGRNKLGPWGRMAAVFARGKTSSGEQITSTAGIFKEAAEAAIPVPITLSKPAQALGHAVAPGIFPGVPEGAVARQLVASLAGIKGQASEPKARQIQRLADRWVQSNGLRNQPMEFTVTDEPSFGKMRSALRAGDTSVAEKVLGQMLKTHTLDQVVKNAETHARRPFTGKQDYEDFFIASLDDKTRSIYTDAQTERMLELQLFYEFILNSHHLR